MAADIVDITDGNQPDILGYLNHILTDLHLALERLDRQGRLIDKHDRLLEDFRPLIDQFRSPAAAYMSSRRMRKGNGASQSRPEGQ